MTLAVTPLCIPPDWQPVVANVNALPPPLRAYIHNLETVCDPSGDVRELFLLRQENAGLRRECEALASAASEINAPQLVARIKRSSKYWGQTEPNQWFEVRLVADNYYQLRGNNNNYRISDVVMGARFDNGAVIDFTNGKVTSETIEAES